jgi:hypothetical protein
MTDPTPSADDTATDYDFVVLGAGIVARPSPGAGQLRARVALIEPGRCVRGPATPNTALLHRV